MAGQERRFILRSVFQFLDNHITFQAADAVNVQNTVQMVGFVLQNNRKIVFRIQRLFFAVVVQIAYGYGAVALDFGALSGNGEAAFVKPNRIFGFTDNFRIDEKTRVGSGSTVFGYFVVNDDDAFGYADLRRGEADAFVCVHRFQHIVKKAADFVGNFGDRFAFLA